MSRQWVLTQSLVLKEQERGKERKADGGQMVRKCCGYIPHQLYNEGSEPQRWEDVGPLRVRQPSSKRGSKRPLTPAWCEVTRRNVNSLQSRGGQT